MARAIAAAFAGLDCESKFIDYSSFTAEFQKTSASGNNGQVASFIRTLEKILVDQIEKNKPDVLLGIAQSPVFSGPVMDRIKRSGIITTYWFVEDFRVETYWKQIVKHFDIFFSIQKNIFRETLSETGTNNHYYLPVAFDNNLDNSPAKSCQDIPISFMGSPYPNRVEAFKKLAPLNIKIFGGGWNRHPIDGVMGDGSPLSDLEARAIYRNTKINLNLHSSLRPQMIGGDFVNPRTFELAGLGCFQLSDRREHMPELYADNEIVQFDDLDELAGLIKYYLKHETERHAIARNARRRTLKNHLYEHRAMEIMQAVRKL